MALALLFGLAVNGSCVALVSAQDDSSKTPPGASAAPPMPPARPSMLIVPESPIVTAPAQAPSWPSTPAAPRAASAAGPPEAPATKVTGEASTPPWTPGKLLALPPYTRTRMHACAVEWQNMKANGTAAEKIWFTFAQSCLVQK